MQTLLRTAFAVPLLIAGQAWGQAPGSTGDQQRTYYFAEAGQESPYRLYVPDSYDADTGAPLVVALHGYGGDPDTFFTAVPELPAPRTAEEETLYRALSEADVMNVIDIVRGEYHIDPDRVYLMGHSMGGFGTWWLGQKHDDLWAAIAPMSGVLPDVDYRLPNLSDVAVHVSIGAEENPAWVEASRAQVEKMKAMGMTVEYYEPAGANHGSMVLPTVPRVLEFFDRH